MKPYERVYASIDLDAISSNIEEIKSNLSKGTMIYGIVKADGYGHGATLVARELEKHVHGLGVATIWEAVNLRKNNIKSSILVLGYTYEGTYENYIDYEIAPTVFSLETAEKLSELAKKYGKISRIHIKVDTGMARIGFLPTEESAEIILEISRLPNIEIEGVFTHFAKADEEDKESSNRQFELFKEFLEILEGKGLVIPICHCSNSAATIDIKPANMSMVRIGIATYGIYPSEEVNRTKVKLTPALSLMSQIVFLKDIQPGCGVSYGLTYRAQGKRRIATIPIGYGDGYPRNLSNKGYVLIRGKKAYIIGRICMDQMMVDVTHIEGVSMGDTVTLVGLEGELEISVEKLSKLAGSFSYEFLCNLGKRIPRVYQKNGQTICRKDYFEEVY